MFWKFEREDTNYDQVIGMIVKADSEEEAWAFARAENWGYKASVDEARVTNITEAPNGVMLIDFLNG